MPNYEYSSLRPSIFRVSVPPILLQGKGNGQQAGVTALDSRLALAIYEKTASRSHDLVVALQHALAADAAAHDHRAEVPVRIRKPPPPQPPLPPPQPRTLRRRSCLRKESAFTCGGAARGSRLDELSATKMITVSYSAEPKKSLSFADQRGQHLVLEREFCPADAPVCYCDVPTEVTVGRLTRRRSSSLDKWIEETLARQHLLSMCVVSLLGCALLGLRQTAK